MLKLIKQIVKQVIVYIVFLIVLNMIGAYLIRDYFKNTYSYLDILLLLFSNSSVISEAGIRNISIIVTVKQLIEGIIFAVLGSAIFAYILNRDKKIILPDKLVLRRRTSEGSNGVLTLGVLLGNPGKEWIYDVQCIVNCSYTKSVSEGIVQRNSEVVRKEERDFVQNYYRFSFKVSDFPHTFWEHYINRDEIYVDNDYIFVIILGTSDGIGGKFKYTKRYSLQDIVVDFHEPEKRFKKTVTNVFTHKQKTKIDWKEFPRVIEAGENEREGVIKEIKEIIKNKRLRT